MSNAVDTCNKKLLVADWLGFLTRSLGSWFESRLRLNLAHDCMTLHCTEPFIITLPLSQYDLNNAEGDVKY